MPTCYQIHFSTIFSIAFLIFLFYTIFQRNGLPSKTKRGSSQITIACGLDCLILHIVVVIETLLLSLSLPPFLAGQGWELGGTLYYFSEIVQNYVHNLQKGKIQKQLLLKSLNQLLVYYWPITIIYAYCYLFQLLSRLVATLQPERSTP